MHQSPDNTRFRDRTLALLRKAVDGGTSYSTISTDTDLPLAWLTAFGRGEIPNPSVNRIEALWAYLTGKKLQVD